MTEYIGPSKDQLKKEYYKAITKRLILLVACIVGIVLFIGFFSLSVFDSISLRETYEIIWNHITGNNDYEIRSIEWWADRYIWNRSIPHIVVAIVAGSSLAICGALMQSLMANPLADPYSTGISSGACFGAVIAIIAGISFSSISGEMGIVTNAFIGALVPALLIIVISARIQMTPATIILIGTGISYFFNSMVTYFMIMTDADTLKSAYIWQIGSLDGMTWNSVPIMLTITVIGSILVFMSWRKLNVMSSGDNSAVSLGLDVHKFRIMCLILMSIMTAAVVSYVGIIGFIGLVAPHIVRLVIGGDNKHVIPLSMVVGSFLLLFADFIANQSANLPVGVVMSLIGSPVFLILILYNRKSKGVMY